MKFVEEIVVEEFLPTVRSMLAESLRERGLTQREVADALGVSQSAVSKYVHGDVAGNRRIREDDRVRKLVDEVADGLSSSELTRVGALVELEVLIRRLERGDLLATLHAEAMPELEAGHLQAAIHDPDSALRTEAQVLASLRRGLRTLETEAGMSELLPNVGSNLVECLPEATGIDQVAGVPGRLFAVKGRLEVAADPEFGASEHVASVLLAAREAGSEARAAINVRYDEAILDRLEETGRTVVEFDATYDDLGAAVDRAFERSPDADVLYHTGDYGIEPIVYVLGPDAPMVARLVAELQ